MHCQSCNADLGGAEARVAIHHSHGHRQHGERCDLVEARALRAQSLPCQRLRDRRSARRPEWPSSPPLLGIIDRIFAGEGYGFILTDGGEQVYFHRNAVHGGLEFERLAEGDRVALNIEAGLKGQQATTVVAAPAQASSP